jgi:hypothetical protein
MKTNDEFQVTDDFTDKEVSENHCIATPAKGICQWIVKKLNVDELQVSEDFTYEEVSEKRQ